MKINKLRSAFQRMIYQTKQVYTILMATQEIPLQYQIECSNVNQKVLEQNIGIMQTIQVAHNVVEFVLETKLF